ncbi:MAG: hypothetical protein FWG87_08305 [Defluviitaleaceae bacterium]|nr:hypothetical protein [Defluviitaleaceae bacterium]
MKIMERRFSRIQRILRAWNADFRGFNGFSRIFSRFHSKLTKCELRGLLITRILKNTPDRIRVNPPNPRKSAFHNLLKMYERGSQIIP